MTKAVYTFLAVVCCLIAVSYAGTVKIAYSNTSPYWGQATRITFNSDTAISAGSNLLYSAPNLAGFTSFGVSTYCQSGSTIVNQSPLLVTSNSLSLQIAEEIAANTDIVCSVRFDVAPKTPPASSGATTVQIASTSQTVTITKDISFPTSFSPSSSNFSVSTSSATTMTTAIPFIDASVSVAIGKLDLTYKSLPADMLFEIDYDFGTLDVSISEITTSLVGDNLFDFVTIHPSQDVRLWLTNAPFSSTSTQLFLLTGTTPADGTLTIPFGTDIFAVQSSASSSSDNYRNIEIGFKLGPDVVTKFNAPSGALNTNFSDILKYYPSPGVLKVAAFLAMTKEAVAISLPIFLPLDMQDTVNTSLSFSVSGDIKWADLVGAGSTCVVSASGGDFPLSTSSSSPHSFQDLAANMQNIFDQSRNVISNFKTLDTNTIALNTDTTSYDLSYDPNMILIVACVFVQSDLTEKDFSIKASLNGWSYTYKSTSRTPSPLTAAAPTNIKTTDTSLSFDFEVTSAEAPASNLIEATFSLDVDSDFYEIRDSNAPIMQCTSSSPKLSLSTKSISYPNLPKLSTSFNSIDGSVKSTDFPITISCVQQILPGAKPSGYNFGVVLFNPISSGFSSGSSTSSPRTAAPPFPTTVETATAETQFMIVTTLPISTEAEVATITTKFANLFVAPTTVTIDELFIVSIASRTADSFIFSPFDGEINSPSQLGRMINTIIIVSTIDLSTASFVQLEDDFIVTKSVGVGSSTVYESPFILPSSTNFSAALNSNFACFSDKQCNSVSLDLHDGSGSSSITACWKGLCVGDGFTIPGPERDNVNSIQSMGPYASILSQSSNANIAQVSMAAFAIVLALFF